MAEAEVRYVPEAAEIVKYVEAAVEVESLLLKVVQSAEVSNPLFEADEFGKLKVWTEPEETMLKSVPEVPVAKVWVEVVKPLSEVMAAVR